MATESVATSPTMDASVDEAFAYLDAAMPAVYAAVESMGNTDQQRLLWLAQKALERAHCLLSESLGIGLERISEGEVQEEAA